MAESIRLEADIDKLYLKSLEDRLQRLKDPHSAQNSKSSRFLSDLSSSKDHQLFHLLTAPTSKNDNDNQFEDNFTGQSIEPNWIQRKVAPQTCAINTEEKKRLLKHDELEAQIRSQLKEQILQVITQELEEEKRESEETNSNQQEQTESEQQFETIEITGELSCQQIEWAQFSDKGV